MTKNIPKHFIAIKINILHHYYTRYLFKVNIVKMELIFLFKLV